MKFLRFILAGIWITASEFLRNQVLFPAYWVDHYHKLGLVFQTLPVNGVLWALWSFILAGLVYTLRKGFGAVTTTVITWVASFPLMWITLFNLQVLPMHLLFFAVPLSVLEVILAVLIAGSSRTRKA